jgi:hypothetical protein
VVEPAPEAPLAEPLDMPCEPLAAPLEPAAEPEPAPLPELRPDVAAGIPVEPPSAPPPPFEESKHAADKSQGTQSRSIGRTARYYPAGLLTMLICRLIPRRGHGNSDRRRVGLVQRRNSSADRFKTMHARSGDESLIIRWSWCS